MKFVFIILNYKSYKDTIRVVKELLSTERLDYKIIVVDNASPNESFMAIAETFSKNNMVDVIQSGENGGYAKGNNFGLQNAKKYNPEYAIIMNNDVHFSWDTIEKLATVYRTLENPAIIAPIQMNPDGSRAKLPTLKLPNFLYDLRSYSILFHLPYHKYYSNTSFPNVQRVGLIQGAFLFTDFRTFENIGFFDECTFLFCEERFTGKSVKDAGLHNYVVLDLQYVHEHSKTINKETSTSLQRRFILDGKLKYTKRYRSLPKIKSIILRIAFHVFEIELYILSMLKKH